jgi:hypothetical protein
MSIRTIRLVQAGSAGNVHPLLVADDRQSLDSQLPKLTPNPELDLNFALPGIPSKPRIDSTLIPPPHSSFIIIHRVQFRKRMHTTRISEAILFQPMAQYLLLKISKTLTNEIPKDFSPLITVDDGAGTHYFPDRSFKERRVEIVLTTEGEKENVK